MDISVSIQEKKEFLTWFLQKHEMHSEELNWFIQDLLDDQRTLEYVHFVERMKDCPKGIMITIRPAGNLSFVFFKGKVRTNDIYTAYHELQLYQQENMFVNVNFPEKEQNILYQAVLEADYAFRQEISRVTEQLLHKITREGEVAYLEREIDRSLFAEDYGAFMYFSNRLKTLKKQL